MKQSGAKISVSSSIKFSIKGSDTLAVTSDPHFGVTDISFENRHTLPFSEVDITGEDKNRHFIWRD